MMETTSIFSIMWPVTILLLSSLGIQLCSGWIQTVEPRMYTTYNQGQIDRFEGNQTYTDFFKLLEIRGETVLIGSRNKVYNVSVNNLTEIKMRRIQWPPSDPHRQLCILKGKSEEECQNYLRIGAHISDDQILVCGTNAYKPLCRQYKFQDGQQNVLRETEAIGICPYDPTHNSTSLYTDGQLYSATVADFTGIDALIYRDPLRTERLDFKQLNEPNFVSSINYGDYVFFFFRESAVEYINCGKMIYSRVARVCKRDKGGPHQFGDRWTSFIKARLNCSVPGDYPFYFNEIQSTSEIVEGVYDSQPRKIIYGVFTTPVNSFGGSAICAFDVDDIMNTFEGPFKEQSSMNSNWLRVSPSKVPEPRPGRCVNDSRTLADASVNFVKVHSLMDDAVPSLFDPLLVRVSLRYRFTTIAVDPQVKALNGQTMDVLFIGTDDGRVLKGISRPRSSGLFVEEIDFSNSGKSSAVNSLSITRIPNHIPKLLIVTNEEVRTMPLYRCSSLTKCRECVGIQDPYCAWDNELGACVAHAEYGGSKRHFLQDLETGSHPACQPSGNNPKPMPNPKPERELGLEDKSRLLCPKCTICTENPCINEVPTTQEKIVIYTADTLGMVVATSVLATLVFGFVAGYLCSKHFRGDSSYSNMPLHAHHQLNRLTDSNLHGEGASYLSPCANNKAAINLVMNVSPKNANDKNANTSDGANKTLQKVKRTYI